ncbi:glutamate-rich WD repeat-containing protein 1-like [Panicum miliaceum]|uniref:Glutamate-rich WD repeat-containing protein 1-like n=1 Tax=Panicum miliaceum TaxID=4540 RepID=A0A3L6SW73_PANMI|nr:glutamate-rich WD repeat-containing protein 1-like [Panicum miliaceum]
MEGNKKQMLATLVGCNYAGTPHELRGCINDLLAMRDTLVARFGFAPGDITVLTDDDRRAAVLPTGANIKRALADMVARAAPGDLVDRVPQGATFTMVSDSCHSGGLIDKEKEQIGPSAVVDDLADDGTSATRAVVRARFLPYPAVVGHLSGASGVDASHHVADHLLALFGADASAKFHHQQRHHDRAPSPDGGILLSGCQTDETSADVAADDGGKACGAFSIAAEKASANYIGIFKLSNISGKKREPIAASTVDGDSDVDCDSSSDEEDEEINEDTKPILHLKKVAHAGCVNRIRSMTQKPHLCATWGDTGHVQVWDLSSFLNSLAEAESGAPAPKEDDIIHKHLPLKVFSGHKDEGYAIDWSPLVTGRLVSGDCNKCIHLWEPTPNNWNIGANPFVGHTASWSPTEADVFASCSVDGTIAIWDIRTGKKPCMSIKAHKADVNVISWNRLASSMIASGCDDGSFSVRDLRSSQNLGPSLERDAEEEAEFRAKMKEQANAPEDLPPQLLFVHQGQKDLKELHWHPQIPSMIISTAIDGFNVLMPSNIDTTIPGNTDATMASAES